MMNEILETIQINLAKEDEKELAGFITPKRTIRNGKIKLSIREATDFVASLEAKK